MQIGVPAMRRRPVRPVAWLCGTLLVQVGMALPYKLCQTLGGSFDLPHAETHAVILPDATGPDTVPGVSALLCKARRVGDFEYLARLLKPTTAAAGLGRRDMDLQDSGSNLPPINGRWHALTNRLLTAADGNDVSRSGSACQRQLSPKTDREPIW